jgi:hypothetical protein
MDTFYNTGNLTLEQRIQFINDCKAVAYNWWVDILDCKKSVRRQRIEMLFEDILAKLNMQCHFVCIDRSYPDWDGKQHFEVGFCTMATSDPEYFLFIYIEDDQMPPILNEYGLQPMR